MAFHREPCSFVEHQRPTMIGMVHELQRLRVRHAGGCARLSRTGWTCVHRV